MASSNFLVLGLDLGVSSIGWALLDPQNQRFAATGVRVFDSGMDEQKFVKGETGASNNVERRSARLHRRQLRRRAARQRELFVCLQEAGLLPLSPAGGSSQGRHQVLTQLDAKLAQSWTGRIRAEAPAVVAPEHLLPYFLRARALDHPLEPPELGRALYHLAQRRGFKSNRREGRGAALASAAARKAEEERSKVKAEMASLEQAISASGARTLGEYLSRLDPAQPHAVRRRWTKRSMFKQEFEAIWSAQSPFHPGRLTDALKHRIHHLLFHQRPIAAGKPGLCELEPGCPRADLFTLSAQRFRLLQKVNDLAIVRDTQPPARLGEDQRRLLADTLESQGDLTFKQLCKLLHLPTGTKFNLEAGGDKKLPGNRAAAVMRRAFDSRWPSLSEAEQKHIVRVWAETEDPEELLRIAMQDWKLDATAARDLAETAAEDGYSALSTRALSKLLPLMETGTPFKTAEKELYGDRFSGRLPKELLPPVADVLPRIPNPAVMRSLTELRKLVNALVRRYGKPARVRIELARDLKRSAKDRQALLESIKDNRSLNQKAVKQILQQTGNPSPSGDDITRARLFDEMQECAYCGSPGSPFSFADLFNGQVEVDHILPRNRFPDDSRANKTLACASCNKLKADRTPFEAFGSDQERWAQIQARIKRLKSRDKRQRFLLQTAEEWTDFTTRHLADTRYTSKLAARYLEELYGGRDVASPGSGQAERAVFASSGMVTATLRRAWGLESILRQPGPSANGQNPGKPRGDHRHHAVDAITIALTSQAAIQRLSAAAAAGDGGNPGRVSSRNLPAPWPDFVASVRPLIDGLHVSHRPCHTLNGPMHDETNYSPPKLHRGKDVAHVRKPVHLLKPKQIADDDVIVDHAVRDAVRAKLALVGGDPKSLETSPPVLQTRSGKQVPIRKVRIRVSGSFQQIGERERERHVALGGNHHVAIFSGPGRKGRLSWHAIVVSRFEALQRKRARQPIVQKVLPGHEDHSFLFSLMGGDMVEMEEGGRSGLFVVRKISEYATGTVVVAFVRERDARLTKEMTKDDMQIIVPETMRKRNCRKVIVDMLGNVHSAND